MENLKKSPLPLFALTSGIAAFLLRLLLAKTGFEAATGLPVPGNTAAVLLPILFVVCAGVLVFLSRRLPKDEAPSFPENFFTADTALLTLPVIGVLLMGVSGLLDAMSIMTPDAISSGGYSSQLHLIFSATALLPALALLSALSVCRKPDSHELNAAPKQSSVLKYRDVMLLVPPVCLVVRLVLAYRIHSVDPVLSRHYIGLLALVFMTLAFYRLSSFAFQTGCFRRFALYGGAAVVLSVAALAEGGQPSHLLLHAGSALTLLGFLLLYQPGSST